MACRLIPHLFRHSSFLITLFLALFETCAHTQSFDATRLRQPSSLGDVKWRVNAGDDPAFAYPSFADSSWPLFDPHKPIDALYPQRPLVIWYRLHVKVDPSTSDLALSENYISQAFEIYVNGERLMELGRVSPWVAYTSRARVLLVSVLVGAIRGVAEFTKDPADLLSNLNERLVGRAGGALSTALIARISADGQVSVANAGHLSPYLDGKEVELPGALPLGVANSILYEKTEFHLDHGSRLTFYSDGVIEAQQPGGELFGFDRAREVSMQSAAEIVATAKRFGQEDDITVLTVTRTAAVATAA